MKIKFRVTTVVISSIVMMALCCCTSVDSQAEDAPVQVETKRVKKNYKQVDVKKLEEDYRKAVNGYPLVLPLIDCSDPVIYIVPVSVDSIAIDKVYLVDGTRDKFNYSHDVYHIHAVMRLFWGKEMIYTVMASNRYAIKIIEISSYEFHEIKQLNSNMWGHNRKSNMRKKIPIVDINEDTWRDHIVLISKRYKPVN